MYICTIDVISTGNNNVREELMKIYTRVWRNIDNATIAKHKWYYFAFFSEFDIAFQSILNILGRC